ALIEHGERPDGSAHISIAYNLGATVVEITLPVVQEKLVVCVTPEVEQSLIDGADRGKCLPWGRDRFHSQIGGYAHRLRLAREVGPGKARIDATCEIANLGSHIPCSQDDSAPRPVGWKRTRQQLAPDAGRLTVGEDEEVGQLPDAVVQSGPCVADNLS